jgi:hypothetical protein
LQEAVRVGDFVAGWLLIVVLLGVLIKRIVDFRSVRMIVLHPFMIYYVGAILAVVARFFTDVLPSSVNSVVSLLIWFFLLMLLISVWIERRRAKSFRE